MIAKPSNSRHLIPILSGTTVGESFWSVKSKVGLIPWWADGLNYLRSPAGCDRCNRSSLIAVRMRRSGRFTPEHTRWQISWCSLLQFLRRFYRSETGARSLTEVVAAGIKKLESAPADEDGPQLEEIIAELRRRESRRLNPVEPPAPISSVWRFLRRWFSRA